MWTTNKEDSVAILFFWLLNNKCLCERVTFWQRKHIFSAKQSAALALPWNYLLLIACCPKCYDMDSLLIGYMHSATVSLCYAIKIFGCNKNGPLFFMRWERNSMKTNQQQQQQQRQENWFKKKIKSTMKMRCCENMVRNSSCWMGKLLEFTCKSSNQRKKCGPLDNADDIHSLAQKKLGFTWA